MSALGEAGWNKALEKVEKVDIDIIRETVRRRGHVMIPHQYFDLANRIAETGFWPTLYDADGKVL